MKKLINSVIELVTVDNSHEEDNEVFEYVQEPSYHSALSWITFGSVAILILLSVIG